MRAKFSWRWLDRATYQADVLGEIMGIGDDLKKGLDMGFDYIGALGKADPQVISLVKVQS